MVIAETSVWINAQRQPDSPDATEFWRLYDMREVVMVGPVLTELLHGSSNEREVDTLLRHVDALHYLEVDQATWTLAGRLRRELRKRGALTGFPDSIIAALAIQHGCAVYTLDGDFGRIPDVRLHGRPPG